MVDSEILIIGSNGQLGNALKIKYPNAKAVDSDELDITSLDSINKFEWSGIKVIINAAAYTNVDGAETDSGRVSAWKVNAIGPANLTQIAQDKNLILVHISTDYVFNGNNRDHTETEDFSPLSVYGTTKAAGDIVIGLLPSSYIIRTSWVIGDGKNFVRTMLDLGKKGINPSVVSDQFGRLTFTSELVRGIDHLLTNNIEFGTYNLTNDGDIVSWADIAKKCFSLAGLNVMVTEISTNEYNQTKSDVAPRPLQSSLDLGKLKATGFVSKDWVSNLTNYIAKDA